MKNRSRIYSLLALEHDVGPFDGGCLIMARAFQRRFGGKIMVLMHRNIAQHAVVQLANGRFLDADGERTPQKSIENFAANELKSIDSYREYRPKTDLPDAPIDMNLSKKIAKLL